MMAHSFLWIDPITIAKIKARKLSILRTSYSTLFAIFSCSAIAMLERSSLVINFAFQLFEQTADFKSSAPVVLFARYFYNPHLQVIIILLNINTELFQYSCDVFMKESL
jgi:hypothetical protein